jgi:hypothetical protein
MVKRTTEPFREAQMKTTSTPAMSLLVMLDVHHYMAPIHRVARGKAVPFHELNGKDDRSVMMSYLASRVIRHPFKLVFTKHHATNIYRALTQDYNWTHEEATKHVGNCVLLTRHTNGEVSQLDMDSFGEEHLSHLCGKELLPENEDACIVEMARALHVDLLITDDHKLLISQTPDVLKLEMSVFRERVLKQVSRKAA